MSVPSRLGVTADVDDGEFRLQLHPQAPVLRHGAVRASVISFMIDVAAGIVLDDDPDAWLLTSDMSVRMRPVPAPDWIGTRSTILRRGQRSATATVDVVTSTGDPVATGAIGFARVQRRESDPPKPPMTPERITTMFGGAGILTRPLREEAGITVLDPTRASVQMEVTPDLRNPAGTLQGAMVALVAEAAAEELASARFDIPAVVIDLDLRYLAQTGAGPVRTRCRSLGDSTRCAHSGRDLRHLERSAHHARLRPHRRHPHLTSPSQGRFQSVASGPLALPAPGAPNSVAHGATRPPGDCRTSTGERRLSWHVRASVGWRVICLPTRIPDELRGHTFTRDPALLMDSVWIPMPTPDNRPAIHGNVRQFT